MRTLSPWCIRAAEMTSLDEPARQVMNVASASITKLCVTLQQVEESDELFMPQPLSPAPSGQLSPGDAAEVGHHPSSLPAWNVGRCVHNGAGLFCSSAARLVLGCGT